MTLFKLKLGNDLHFHHSFCSAHISLRFRWAMRVVSGITETHLWPDQALEAVVKLDAVEGKCFFTIVQSWWRHTGLVY